MMYQHLKRHVCSATFLLLLLTPSLGFAAEAKKVEIFVTSWCGYCKKLERFLDQKDIAFTRYDIEKNERAAAAFESMGGTGVPVTRIGTEIVYGYDPDRILELL